MDSTARESAEAARENVSHRHIKRHISVLHIRETSVFGDTARPIAEQLCFDSNNRLPSVPQDGKLRRFDMHTNITFTLNCLFLSGRITRRLPINYLHNRDNYEKTQVVYDLQLGWTTRIKVHTVHQQIWGRFKSHWDFAETWVSLLLLLRRLFCTRDKSTSGMPLFPGQAAWMEEEIEECEKADEWMGTEGEKNKHTLLLTTKSPFTQDVVK